MSEKSPKIEQDSGENKQQNPLQVFVCELGYSALKWLDDESKKKGRIMSAYKKHGDDLIVGEDALNRPSPSYLISIDDLLMAYPFMCREALKEADVPASKKGNIHMVVGLPYTNWEKENRLPDRGRVGMLEKTLLAEGYARVSIYPQGIGGIRHWMNMNPEKITGNILGVDIGFNTVILTLYSPEKKRILYGNTFSKKGIHQLVMDHLAPKIEQLFPSRAPLPINMCYILEAGRVQTGDGFEDVRGEIAAASDEYAAILMQQIKSELQANVGEGFTFDTMLFFGGGTYFVKDSLVQGKNVKMYVPETPEFANAIGMASAARNN